MDWVKLTTIKTFIHFNVMLISCLIMLSGCGSAPVYPNTPEITQATVTFIKRKTASQPDTLLLKFNFRDGNGDLGLNIEDTLPPFSRFVDPNKTALNLNYNNLFIDFWEKQTDGSYKKIDFGQLNYYTRFPRLDTDRQNTYLEGVFYYPLTSTNFANRLKKPVKLKVQIQDRALNKSNLIETKEFVITP